MAEKDFDKIFRDRLGEYETPAGKDVWSAIENSLDVQANKTEKIAGPVFGKFAHGKRKAFYYAASVAAILVLALVLMEPDSQSYIHWDKQIAISDENLSDLREEPDEKTIFSEKFKPDGYMEDSGLSYSESLVTEEVGVASVLESAGEAGIAAVAAVAVSVTEPQNKKALNGSGNDGNTTESYTGNDPGKADREVALEQTRNYQQNLYADNWNSGDLKELEENYNRKKYSLSLFSNVVSRNNICVSRQYLSTMAASSISYSSSDLQTMEIISEAKYSLPLNIGLQAQVKVSQNFSVGVGLSYTWLRSKYDGLVNKKYYRIKQSLHYIGIPVNAYFTLMDKNNFYCYANIGGAIEKGIKASYKFLSYGGFSRSADADIDGFQYSVNAGFGLEYRFAEQFGVYLEPNIVYYFDSNIPASIRTDQPLQVKAEIGFRFHLK